MGYIFEWEPVKAEANVRKHHVTFDEASTVFGNPLNLVMADPDHSRDEERYLLLGMSNRMLKTSASGVLASLRGSTISGESVFSGPKARRAQPMLKLSIITKGTIVCP